jgi:hypothetical protein
MSPKEIVAEDIKTNHKGTTIDKHISRIKNLLASGGQVVQQNKTLFLFVTTEKQIVEFHTYNADPGPQLAENTRKFFRMLKKAGAKQVYTKYNNPKISDLFKLLEPEFKAQITKDKTYKAKVSLT